MPASERHVTFQPTYLFNLSDLGITSMDLHSALVNKPDHGNTIIDDGSFTWKGGQVGDIAGVSLAFNPASVLGAAHNHPG